MLIRRHRLCQRKEGDIDNLAADLRKCSGSQMRQGLNRSISQQSLEGAGSEVLQLVLINSPRISTKERRNIQDCWVTIASLPEGAVISRQRKMNAAYRSRFPGR